MNREVLMNELKIRGLTCTNEQANSLFDIMQTTLEANEKFNLTAITNEEEFVEKMIFDSALPLIASDLSENKVLDLGTGAGFPGLVLYVLNPSIKLTLLDSNSKKINYLNELCINKNYKIKCVNFRAEDYSKSHVESYDAVIARAVAPLNILLELAMPMIKVEGHFIAMKGLNYEEEIEQSKNALKKLDCSIEEVYEDELPSNGDKRAIIIIKKNQSTKKKYPRDYSEIKRNPL